MSTRSVRLDDEAEKALSEIVDRTGLSISDAIKQGLIVYREKSLANAARKPADFFKEFDLGEGGYSIGPARQAKTLVQQKLRARQANMIEAVPRGFRTVCSQWDPGVTALCIKFWKDPLTAITDYHAKYSSWPRKMRPLNGVVTHLIIQKPTAANRGGTH